METHIAISTILLVFFLLSWFSWAEPVEDKQALLDFMDGIPRVRKLNWNSSTPVCSSWIGVVCSSDGSRVEELHLPGLGISGEIPPNTLSRLTSLRTLSLRANALTGDFPPDFGNLTALTDIHLQFNAFSGPLPFDFSVWKSLTDIDLSFNGFNGSIPTSLSSLTQLVTLDLSHNSLSGSIPDLQLPNLKHLNLSENDLGGVVPNSLRGFPNDSFFGNKKLIFVAPSPPPLVPPATQLPPPGKEHHENPRKLNESAVLGIIVGGCAVGFVAVALFLILLCSRTKSESFGSGKFGKGDRSPDEKVVAAKQDENNRLVFFEGCNFAFDLEDLLRASAEVLGKGSLGTAYKAVMEDATTVVVKRLKDVGAGRKEFEQQMEVMGGLKHENVVELRAYYYSKDEKLMVCDYYNLGSVSSRLHGKRGEERTPLDWDSRVRIALGAARGIAFIHASNGGKLVHGNIKSSNVFLNHDLYGCVADYGITTLMNPMVPPVSRAAGYRAPEVYDTRKATQMSDVYSFGVLLLELLTGKSPIQVTGGGDEIIHLVRWVQSVVREEWTAEVFDVELMKIANIEEEMVEMLQIAMACVTRLADRRPKMTKVVRRIEDLKKMDTGTRPSTEGQSEGSSAITPPAGGLASTSF